MQQKLRGQKIAYKKFAANQRPAHKFVSTCIQIISAKAT